MLYNDSLGTPCLSTNHLYSYNCAVQMVSPSSVTIRIKSAFNILQTIISQICFVQLDNVLVTLSDVSTKRYEYDLRKSDLETQRLVAAELRVLLDCDVYQSSSEEEEGKEQDVLFEVYHHTVLSRKNKLPLKRRILKKPARLCQEHSIVFDITAAVRQWMVAPIDIHEISIEVRHADGRPLQSTDHINLDLDGVQFPVNPLDIKWDTSPVLVLYLFDEEGVSYEDVTHLLSKEKEIVKRSVISVPESEISVSESSCRLVKRDVYVADIGLQDIKFPTRINLNYCAGSCNWPFPDEVNAPRSAWMQGRISHLSGEMPPPCCAPKDFDPVVISRKIGNIMETKVEMIKVSSCECK